MNRIQSLATQHIDPSRPYRFHYRGKQYEGVAGDTLATALFANGVRIFSRSLKYHRPRGLYSLDGESANTFMSVNGEPNVCAENTRLQPGMRVRPQNVVGSPEFDLMGFMDRLGWAMPTGWYYRMFHKPAPIWPLAVKQIRKAAGLGKLSPDFQMDGVFDEIYPTADVCVIGGGPAGMTAALTAAEAGLRVILLENRPWLGGFFEYRPREYETGIPLYECALALAQRTEQAPNIRTFKNTAVLGAYPNNRITAFQRGTESDPFRERYIEIDAKSVVAASGCRERPLLFENNDRPGVMQVGCAHRLVRTWGLLPGKRAVFCIGDDLGLEAAIDLYNQGDQGLEIACVADIRQNGADPDLVASLEAKKIPYLSGWTVLKSNGRKCVISVVLRSLNQDRTSDFACDTLVASAGPAPLTGPLSLAGAKLAYDAQSGFFLPKEMPPHMHAAGRMLGFVDPAAIEASGRLAGLKSAAACGKALEKEIRAAEASLAALPGPQKGVSFVTGLSPGKKTFICFDEDTTLKNVDQALQMGFDVPELIKRFASVGTGPGQGGIPAENLPLYVNQSGLTPDQNPVPTTVRAPLVPVYMATYAGTHQNMKKRTPLHDLQVGAGGKMERTGAWVRARRFTTDASARSEIENVRHNVGLMDVSTLGKFRLFGPDALKALQRVYVGDMSKIADSKLKYSAMCNADGCVIDDGVVIKRAENDYYFTTSTTRADATTEWIRYHTRYDNWDFHIVNLTDAFGAVNLAGPNARRVLEKVTRADVSHMAFPFAGFRELLIREIPVRALRLAFVGELSYELHAPASCMPALWKILAESGAEFGLKEFGLEAQSTLRMEKGHIIIGSESEQRTTLHDVGLGFLWQRNKADAQTVVGAEALRATERQKGRLKLAGFKMASPLDPVPKDGSVIVDHKIRGYVCTARFSYALNEPVGMALVEDPLNKLGSRLDIYEDGCNGKLLKATIVPMPFYDPKGERMRG